MKSFGKQPVFDIKTYSRRKPRNKHAAKEKCTVFMNTQEAPFSDSSTSINEEHKKMEPKKSSEGKKLWHGITDISNMPAMKRQSKEEKKTSNKMKTRAECGEQEIGKEHTGPIEDVYDIFAEKTSARVTRSKTQHRRKAASKPPLEIKESCKLYENYDAIPELMLLETPVPKNVLDQEKLQSTINEKSVDSCLNDKSVVASKAVVMQEQLYSATSLITEYPESQQSSVIQMEEEHEFETVSDAVTSTDSHVKKSETRKTGSYYTYYTHEWTLVSDSDDSEPSIEILREDEVSFSILTRTSQFEFSEKMILDSKSSFTHKGASKTKPPFPYTIRKYKTDAQIRRGRKNSTLEDINFAKHIEDVTMTEKISMIFQGADVSALKKTEERRNHDPLNIHDPTECLNITDHDMQHPVQDPHDVVMPNAVDLVENAKPKPPLPCSVGRLNAQTIGGCKNSTLMDTNFARNIEDVTITEKISVIYAGADVSALKTQEERRNHDPTECLIITDHNMQHPVDQDPHDVVMPNAVDLVENVPCIYHRSQSPHRIISSTRISDANRSDISIPDLSCIPGKTEATLKPPLPCSVGRLNAQTIGGCKNSTLMDTNFARNIEDVTITEKISVIYAGTDSSVLKPENISKDIDDGPQKVISSTRIQGNNPSDISVPDLSCITKKAEEPYVNIESPGLTAVITNVDVCPDYVCSTRNKNTENVHPLEGLPDLSCILGKPPGHDNKTIQLQTTPKTENLQTVLSKPSRCKRYSKQRHGQLQPKSSTFLFESQFINIEKIIPDISAIVPNKAGNLFGQRHQTKPSNKKSHRSGTSLKKSDVKQNDDPTEDTRSDGYDEPHASETEVVHGIEGSPAKKSFPRCDAEATKDKRPTYGLAAKQTTPVSSTPEHSKDLIAMEVDISEVPPPVYSEDELVMGATTRHCITDEIGFQSNDATVYTENMNSQRNDWDGYNPGGFPVCSLVAFPDNVRNKPSKLVFWHVSPRKWKEIQANCDTSDALAMTATARKLRTFSNHYANTS